MEKKHVYDGLTFRSQRMFRPWASLKMGYPRFYWLIISIPFRQGQCLAVSCGPDLSPGRYGKLQPCSPSRRYLHAQRWCLLHASQRASSCRSEAQVHPGSSNMASNVGWLHTARIQCSAKIDITSLFQVVQVRWLDEPVPRHVQLKTSA